MQYSFFNLIVSLKKLNNVEDKIYFSSDKQFSEFEQGKLLSKLMNQFSYKIEFLNNIRSMIDFKFTKKTIYFFYGQQAFFFITCFNPFIALQVIKRESVFVLPCLITC